MLHEPSDANVACSYFDDESFSDLSISTGSEKFKVHKVIL